MTYVGVGKRELSPALQEQLDKIFEQANKDAARITEQAYHAVAYLKSGLPCRDYNRMVGKKAIQPCADYEDTPCA
jgi:hypothetical protein